MCDMMTGFFSMEKTLEKDIFRNACNEKTWLASLKPWTKQLLQLQAHVC